MSGYEHLASPIQLGSVTLKNRFMKNGTGFFWDDPDQGSHINQRYLDYCERLARGGAALISSATGPLTRDLAAKMPGFKINSDEYLADWSRWADTIHRHDALAFAQIFHLGPMTPLFVSAPAGVSASSIPREESPRPGFTVPREVSVPEIEDIIDMFAEAAERMKRAGLDGTEVNGACNHFLNNFMSRAWNRRTDEYGTQSIENRTRVFVSVIREIKRRNGADWPVIALFNAQEVDLRDGISIAEGCQIARELVAAGADALEVRAEYYTWTDDVERRQSLHFPDIYVYPGWPRGARNPYVGTSDVGAGNNIPMAAEIKKVVTVPVITVGRLDADLAERAIAAGKFDIASFNRRLLADPEMPRKTLNGAVRDVNPCSSCMTCFDACEHFQPVRCRVNAALGREAEFEPRPARRKKKVLVIGGGPAGMEAARVAALRGHEVVLYEKQHRLGGSLPVAALVKGPREDIRGLVHYLDRQVRRAGVDLHLGRTADMGTITAENPDVVVVAAGGTHRIPKIPGMDRRNVLTADRLHQMSKALVRFVDPLVLRRMQHLPVARNLMIGRRVVIMGGQLHGCQTAEYLVGLGKQVTIVTEESEAELGAGLLEVFMKPYLLYWLADHGVQFITEAKYQRVDEAGLWVRTVDGELTRLAADTVVTALPLQPNLAARRLAEAAGREMHVIGDAADPRLIVDAIHSGAEVGHLL